MNLENTKVYTTDPEVIRKYAELCGKKFECEITSSIGVYNCDTYKKINDFMMGSPVDIDSDFKQLTTDQINALYDEKFGRAEVTDVDEPKNGEWWMCDRGGVNTVLLRLEDDWRGDDNDTYSYHDAVPLYKMKRVDVVESVSLDMSDLRPVIDVDGKLYTVDDVRALLSLQDLPTSEWKNGDVCDYKNEDDEWESNGRYVCFDSFAEHHVFCADNMEMYHAASDQIRKPETPEQREERERLEAAIELTHAYWGVKTDAKPSDELLKAMLRIVDKTGYRKQKDGE